MSFGFIGFHNMNMYGIANYNMFGGCYNPYGRMVAAQCLHNPFLVFETAKQLINGNFPTLQPYSHTYPCQQQWSYPDYSALNLPQYTDYYHSKGSLYDNIYTSYAAVSQYQVPTYSYPAYDYSSSYTNSYSNNMFDALGLSLSTTKKSSVNNGVSVNSTQTEKVDEVTSEVRAERKIYPPIYEQIAGAHLNQAFLNKTKEVAKNIGCDYQDLLAVMNSESTLNPKSEHKNKKGEVTAVGLIQFTRDAAIPEMNRIYGLNLTIEKIKNMSAIEQLDLVQKYYEMNRHNMPSGKLTAADLYSVTFLPSRASREVLCQKGEAGNSYYESNKGLDMNYDKKITKDDLEQRLAQKRVRLSTFA
ncbi:hypothetical protein IKU74_07520 [bacterium]|nr:hypothetical protein [bacterium]